MISPNAFITVQDVKDYLKIEHDLEDALLENLINRATDILEKERYFKGIKEREYTETHDGEGTPEIFLLNYPVTNVTSVKINGTPINDYQVSKDNGVLKYAGIFPEGFGNIEVSYTAGYNPVPESFVAECIDIVADLYENRSGKR
ncbi:head-tail connector protein [Thermoactinomyces sp. FSL K6-2592]|jgi:hypothetical protein|uniref:head-tail connector protein n=1 Tax=Thermoactinomyces sp. FSL K6-2592 TaxID=2975347 RepID=UPI0030F5D89B